MQPARNTLAGSGKYGAMNLMSDADVIARSRDCCQEFEMIFERHARSILRYLRLRVGDDLAEELTAETFAEAFRHRGRYSERHSSALPWLYGIAANLVRMHWRSEQRRLRAYAEAAGIREQPISDSADGVDLEWLPPALSDGLIGLPRGQREVLLLHAWAELSHAEIAHALSISEGTVRKRLHRARASLAKQLAGIRKPVPGRQ